MSLTPAAVRRWHPGGVIEYLLVFPEREDAESVADELRESDEYDQVSVVREALAGEDDAEDHDWAVHVTVATIDDPTSAVAEALAERFDEICAEHDGWLDRDVRG